jgi:geranylgeranyl pyrophosphate synthase
LTPTTGNLPVRTASPSLAAYLDDLRQTVEHALDRALAASDAPPLVVEAMRYGLMGGGKRLRPSLTLAAAESAGPSVGQNLDAARALAMPFGVAVEMIHSYSLIHDDLPAMDDDALRRGRPTTHVVFGDGLAILAGDGLLTEAFAHAAGSAATPRDPAPGEPGRDRRLVAVRILAAAAGAAGMVGGQGIDLAAAGRVRDRSLSLAGQTALEDMHRRKTGALIRAAAVLGGVSVGAADPALQALDAYARELGLAFQIIDDVLDVEGSKDVLGKTAGKDAAAGKPTYPALFGVAASRRLAAESVDRATAALERAGLGGRLTEIAAWSLQRDT